MSTRSVAPLLSVVAMAFTLAASAQSPLTEWHSDALNLRFNYPSDLTQANAAEALKDGHLTLLGISGISDPALAAATRCLRPQLLLQLTPPPASAPVTQEPAPDRGSTVTIHPPISATILLAELDVTCLTPEEQATSKDLLANMAELVAKVPGMTSIAQPAWYNIGWQKVHMAAAQGMPQGSPETPAGAIPAQLFTMGLSTTWNNHLLVWYFSSNSTDVLNRITKSTVRFGRSAAAPLYPVTIGNSTNSAR